MQVKVYDGDTSDSLLIPSRRPTPGTGYLEALGAPNVSVEWNSIDQVFEKGIKLKNGKVIELDMIVCATGFDTTWKPRFPIIGRGGINLAEQWKMHPRTYLSFAVHNFPNYFSMSIFPICATEWITE
jgi:cation diffusion facilitator CzcD-associated flavoprotein CzcO